MGINNSLVSSVEESQLIFIEPGARSYGVMIRRSCQIAGPPTRLELKKQVLVSCLVVDKLVMVSLEYLSRPRGNERNCICARYTVPHVIL